jgi:hypothetical protein
VRVYRPSGRGKVRIHPFARGHENFEPILLNPAFTSTLHETFDIKIDLENACEEVIYYVEKAGLIRQLNESDAQIGYTRVYENHDSVEEVLLQTWAYLVLLSISMVGFFAILAILRKVALTNSDDRPRDYKTKCAAAHKISNVIENAVELHKRGTKGKGRVMVSEAGL